MKFETENSIPFSTLVHTKHISKRTVRLVQVPLKEEYIGLLLHVTSKGAPPAHLTDSQGGQGLNCVVASPCVKMMSHAP